MDKQFLHPAVQDVLRFFEYEHLRPELQPVSKLYYQLAHKLVSDGEPQLEGPQLTIALHKLLESKDAAVRAAL